MDYLRKLLFEVMRQDMGVMAEHGDNEQSLLDEIMTADYEILSEYEKTFLAPLYEQLYKAVKENEDINECPLYYECGVWFNTSDEYIDMETPAGALVTNDYSEIMELLSDCGLTLIFKDNDPFIRKL